MPSTTVIVFGAFDPLHEGHLDFFRQAKELGTTLMVVVARDGSIRSHKGREPFKPEDARLAAVAAVSMVDEALLGNNQADRYDLLAQLHFDIVALGYDQIPSDEVVRQELDKRGKMNVTIARLNPFHPETFKSTYVRHDS